MEKKSSEIELAMLTCQQGVQKRFDELDAKLEELKQTSKANVKLLSSQHDELAKNVAVLSAKLDLIHEYDMAGKKGGVNVRAVGHDSHTDQTGQGHYLAGRDLHAKHGITGAILVSGMLWLALLIGIIVYIAMK